MEFYHNNGTGNKRKKYATNGIEEIGAPVRQRSQANARERDRTHSVNTAFSTLRTLIPTEPKDRKLSKIETLRLASSYISHLGTQLMAGPIDQPCLRLSNKIEETSSRVCTFCIAHKKTAVSQLCTNLKLKVIFLVSNASSTKKMAQFMKTDEYDYRDDFEGQIVLNPGSPAAIFGPNDLTAIYY